MTNVLLKQIKKSSVRSTDFIENQIDLEEKDETPLAPNKSNDSALAQVGNEKSNVQFSDQTGTESSVLATDIMENLNESKGKSEKVGLEFKQDKHISHMCSGKATEWVPFNHKLGTVAKVVEDAIINDIIMVRLVFLLCLVPTIVGVGVLGRCLRAFCMTV